MKKIFLMFLTSALFTSSAFALDQKRISFNWRGFGSGDITFYTNYSEHQLVVQANAFCQKLEKGVEKISKVKVTIDSDFSLTNAAPSEDLALTQALGSPLTTISALVTCK